MQVYKDMPRFLLMHQSLLSHDDINLVEVEDEDLAGTLLAMHESGELDDALVIVMADHGHRFAELRETHQGMLEERLPFFAISLPAKFRTSDRGRQMYANLLGNRNRLTTPFDIHATLWDILHVPEDLASVQDASKRSLSLFRPILERRTCEQAGISVHWCTCLNWEDAMGTFEGRKLAHILASAIVDAFNRQLKDVFHLCAQLSLQELLDAKKLISTDRSGEVKERFWPNTDGNNATTYYQIKLRTTPGNAVYEVTVSFLCYLLLDINSAVLVVAIGTREVTLFYSSEEVHIDLSSVSHANRFGDAPHCIIDQNYFLATYCVCLDKVSLVNT
ncbi:hypothetical protein OESDEN_04460 [Oesophagostomum dentatum]|uniref:Uncharacterized protein n=1 Tax=Oesophagostomum dentatum TaxID=61180 RepID=A0A0B1TDG3_OESDE|nr:hypothetical protein OESDEN_04460 [Oesophagostomum dentatum]